MTAEWDWSKCDPELVSEAQCAAWHEGFRDSVQTRVLHVRSGITGQLETITCKPSDAFMEFVKNYVTKPPDKLLAELEKINKEKTELEAEKKAIVGKMDQELKSLCDREQTIRDLKRKRDQEPPKSDDDPPAAKPEQQKNEKDQPRAEEEQPRADGNAPCSKKPRTDPTKPDKDKPSDTGGGGSG